MLPVYLYIFGMFCLCITGIGLSWQGTLFQPHIPLEDLYTSPQALTQTAVLLILLRAFAGGCTAMTGIEAIANAGSLLQQPTAKIAARILLLMGACLGVFFISLTWITNAFQLYPLPDKSLVSQITALCWGNGFFYIAFQGLMTLILLFAANTAFAGFPKLASMLAEDHWLPRQLAALGDRLVFSNGILLLALVASLLIFFFQGDPHSLIPLYAVGVFLAFTLSQFGMAIHWFKTSKRSWKKIIINTLGTLCTLTVLLITLEAKFFEGAFVVVLILPLFLISLIAVRKHYAQVDALLKIAPNTSFEKHTRYFTKSPKRMVIIPISKLHRGALEALAMGRELSSNVTALIIDIDNPVRRVEETCRNIEALDWGINIQVVYSPYRSIIQPVIDFVHTMDHKHASPAVLVLPEFVLHNKWLEFLLHNHTAHNIEKALESLETLEGEARAIVKVPYYLPHSKNSS